MFIYNAISHLRFFEWHLWFSEGREDAEDDELPYSTVECKNSRKNLEKLNDNLRKDLHLSIRIPPTGKHLHRDRKINSAWWIESDNVMCKNVPEKTHSGMKGHPEEHLLWHGLSDMTRKQSINRYTGTSSRLKNVKNSNEQVNNENNGDHVSILRVLLWLNRYLRFRPSIINAAVNS